MATLQREVTLHWLQHAFWLLFCLFVALGSAPALAATVNGLTITENLPQASRGTSYSHTITVTGGTPPYVFTQLAPNDLPASLTLSAGGVISGVVSCLIGNGNHKQPIRITDSSSPTQIVANFTANADQLAMNVTTGPGVCGTLTVSPMSLPNPAVGVSYSQNITVSGGIGPYTFAVTAGVLPAGLTLNAATGAITGTPISGGAFSFTITATDAAFSTGSRAYSGTVLAALALNPASLPATTQNIVYSQTVTASGGTAPYTYALAGSLPTGLSLNISTGAVTGTPTAAGTYSFTINASDSIGAFGTGAYSIVINPTMTIAPATLPTTTQGAAYNQTVTASGGTGAKTYSVSAGTLPTGLSLNTSSGAITGTSSAAGTFNFTINAMDSVGSTAAQPYSIVVNSLITVNPVSLPATTAGITYSQSVSTTGGTGAMTYGVSAGSLPAGLSLTAATGALTGMPSAPGAFTFTITATDTVGATGSRAYTMTVNAALAVTPVSLPAATIGSAYSQSVSATGGTGAVTLSLSAGSLPPGLSFNTATGAITGTPSASGSFNFTITATDSLGATGSAAYNFTVDAITLTLNPASLPAWTQGFAYSQSVTASGGTAPYTYGIGAGALPAGLSLNSSSGAITGTPSGSGTSNFTVTATDSLSSTGARVYSIAINAALAVAPATLPATTQGVAYNQSVTASGGTGAISYAVSAGSLPTGLSLNTAAGAITGTPGSAGTTNFTITATDSIGAMASQAYAVTVNAAITINPASLPAGTVGSAYGQSLTATGGTGALTFSVSAGALPAGLSLNASSGAITGTPTGAGTSNFTITGTDAVGAIGSRAYSVTVSSGLAVNPASLPNGAVGTAYSQVVSGSGGTAPYTYSVSAGALPSGLSLNASTGAITGTPTTAATSNFAITVTDSVGATGAQGYAVTINGAIAISPATLPATTIGIAYSQSVSASGGNGSYTYGVSAGSLPSGLSLNAGTGAITGTTTAAGTFNFTITATDGLGAMGSRAYSTVINAANSVNPASLPATTQGIAYSQTLTVIGGTGPHTFAISAGALPAGVLLNPMTGALTGTPTASGTFNFTVSVTDSSGATGSRAYTITVNAPLAMIPASLPTGTAGTAYSQTVAASGGTGVATFAVTAGSLPSGLSLNAASGAITGMPGSAGTSNFTITATDSVGATGSRAYAVTINAGVTVNPASLPATTIGVAYSQAVSGSGGNGSYTYGISAGSLPTGLVLNSATGGISGTPTAAGTFNFTITATDGLGANGSRNYSVIVNPALSVNPPSVPGGSVGAAYNQTITTTGGTGAATFAVSAGALPAGLALNPASGAITGTPTAAGTSNFTITATDAVGATGSRAYSVVVNNAIAMNPASLPAGVVGTTYSQTVIASGGSGVFTYGVSAGSLPAGLALNPATGAITGTPTTAATSNFTITATDGLGATGSRAYTVTVNSAIVVNPVTLTSGAVGAAYSQTVTAAGGSGSFTFSVSAGALPTGLALNASTGVISGTPGSAGTANFSITATDGLGAAGSRAYAVAINAAMTLNPPTLPAGMVAISYAQTLTATGGSGSYSYSVSAGNLPPGFALNASTGVFSGTPVTAGTYTFTITATDTLGASAAHSYSLAFNAAVAVGPASLPNPIVGTSYSQVVTGSGGTGTYAFTVSAGTLPPGLSLAAAPPVASAASSSTGAAAASAATIMLSGMPTAAGTWNFTVTATDDLGFTGARAYALTVALPTLSVVSGVANGAVGSPYNQVLVVTGGTAPYSYAVTGGQLPPGVTLDPATGVLSGMPTMPGSFAFTVTVTDANGATGTATQTIVVSTRPDPTLDSAVRGVNAAQVSAAARFGTAQMDNVTARLRMLHLGHDPCADRFDVGTNIRWERASYAEGVAAPAEQKSDAERRRSRCERPYAVWAGGNIDFGFLRHSSASNRSDFRTSGLTLGADMKVRDGLIVGAAVGYGRDETEVDGAGSESRAHAQNLTVYGTFQPIKSVYIDAIAGYGGLSFDARRWQSTDMVMLSGDRDGSQFFGSLAVSTTLNASGLKLAPYARYDHVRSRLDGYGEIGSATAVLTYGTMSVTEDSLALGLYAGVSLPLGSAIIEPGLRLEQRSVRSGAVDQGMTYSDMQSVGYLLRNAADTDGRTSAALSVLLRFGLAATVGFEYSYTGSSDAFRNESVRAVLRAPF